MREIPCVSCLNFGVQALELGSRVGGGEVPVDAGLVGVPLAEPGRGPLGERDYLADGTRVLPFRTFCKGLALP